MVAERRREIEQRGNLAGTLDQVRQELDLALDAEREFLAGKDGDDARFAEMTLDALPPDTAGAVRELSDYHWQSAEGQQHYANVLAHAARRGAGRAVRRDEAGAR